jgi:hypothetical protein
METFLFALGIAFCLLLVLGVFVVGYLVLEVVRAHADNYDDLEFDDDDDFGFEDTRTTGKTSDAEVRTLLGAVYPLDKERGKN